MKWLPLLCIIVVSCGNPDPEQLKSNLSGYWEIEKVLLPNGSEKQYTINLNIDYIELEGIQGVRKKLKPQLDGSFISFDQNEAFTALIRNDSLILQYETPYSQWEETVLEADESHLVLLNTDGKKFFYKSYEPLSFD